MKNVQLKDKQTKENIYPVNNLDSTVVDGSETKTWRDVIKNSSGGGGTDYSDYFDASNNDLQFVAKNVTFNKNKSVNVNNTSFIIDRDSKFWCYTTPSLCNGLEIIVGDTNINTSLYITMWSKNSEKVELSKAIYDLEKRIQALEDSSTI